MFTIHAKVLIFCDTDKLLPIFIDTLTSLLIIIHKWRKMEITETVNFNEIIW